MKLIEKLMNIQTELKVPKNQLNKFGGYKFRNCEDILEAVKPICAKQKCVVTVSDEVQHIGDRYYIIATASLHDTESDDIIRATANAREEETKKGMDASQISGSASSYARKYALNGLFAIDDTKDSDTTNKHGEDEMEPDSVRMSTKSQQETIASAYKTRLTEFLTVKGFESLEAMTWEEAEEQIKKLSEAAAKKNAK